MAAELKLLTQALGDPVADIAETLGSLEIDVQSAVESYLGMTVIVNRQRDRDEAGDHSGYAFTAFAEATRSTPVRTSLLVPLPGARVILYAGRPGAFIDLAADLAWLSGNELADYVLDAHLSPPEASGATTSLRASSTIYQAVGVLVGRGRTPEQAHVELDKLARSLETDLLGAARALLAAPDTERA